jgi:hypothetical protein
MLADPLLLLLLLLLQSCRGSEAATDGHALLPLQLLPHMLLLLSHLLHFKHLVLLQLLVLVQVAGIVLPAATAAGAARPGCSLLLLLLKHPEGIWVQIAHQMVTGL